MHEYVLAWIDYFLTNSFLILLQHLFCYTLCLCSMKSMRTRWTHWPRRHWLRSRSSTQFLMLRFWARFLGDHWRIRRGIKVAALWSFQLVDKFGSCVISRCQGVVNFYPWMARILFFYFSRVWVHNMDYYGFFSTCFYYIYG